MSISPRILYVSPFRPHNRVCGSDMRSHHIERALRRIGTVEVVVLADDDELRASPEPVDEAEVTRTFQIIRRPKRGAIDKLRWTIDARCPYPNGYSLGAEAARYFEHTLKTFDIVWFFRLRCPDMFPQAVWPRSILDIDDIPSTYERTKLQVAGKVSERLLSLRRVFSWRRRERLLDQRFTLLTVCSPEDQEYLNHLGLRTPIHVIPNGCEMPIRPPIRIAAHPPRIGFIGLFDERKDLCPNIDGIQWFVNNCWPRIKANVPDARLRLIGKGGTALATANSIDALGWLADPSDEIKTWSLMIAPIRVGGGTRVKIAQGFSQKCPIVSSSLGAQGYNPRDGYNMYLADSVEAFSAACIRAIQMPQEAAGIAENAWNEFLEKWTWESIAPRVCVATERCLRLNGHRYG